MYIFQIVMINKLFSIKYKIFSFFLKIFLKSYKTTINYVLKLLNIFLKRK